MRGRRLPEWAVDLWFRRLGRNRPRGPVERAQALHGADADAEARGGLGSGERAARIEDALA